MVSEGLVLLVVIPKLVTVSANFALVNLVVTNTSSLLPKLVMLPTDSAAKIFIIK